jgi:hypothetical protein
MDPNTIFAVISQYLVAVITAGGGLAAVAYALFRFFGSSWLESKFAERLQNLKSEQDQAIRYVQSTIDREIHRAKKLYDSEFTALSECWKLLREAYDQSAGTIASFTERIERLTDEELERFLTQVGMDEWQRNQLMAHGGRDRQSTFHVWCEWKRYTQLVNISQKFRSYLDANSIFFAEGFTEIFRELDTMIAVSNFEYRDRIDHYGTGSELARSYDATKKLRTDGEPKMMKLEEMVRARLWSVAMDGKAEPPGVT